MELRGKNACTNTGTHFSGEGRDGVVWNQPLVQQYHTDSVVLFGMPGWLVAALWRPMPTGKVAHCNTFTSPACKISGLKEARTCLQTVYFWSYKHIYFWWKPTDMPVQKRKQKGLRVKISHIYWSFSSDTMAVRGLKYTTYASFWVVG